MLKCNQEIYDACRMRGGSRWKQVAQIKIQQEYDKQFTILLNKLKSKNNCRANKPINDIYLTIDKFKYNVYSKIDLQNYIWDLMKIQ